MIFEISDKKARAIEYRIARTLKEGWCANIKDLNESEYIGMRGVTISPMGTNFPKIHIIVEKPTGAVTIKMFWTDYESEEISKTYLQNYLNKEGVYELENLYDIIDARIYEYLSDYITSEDGKTVLEANEHTKIRAERDFPRKNQEPKEEEGEPPEDDSILDI